VCTYIYIFLTFHLSSINSIAKTFYLRVIPWSRLCCAWPLSGFPFGKQWRDLSYILGFPGLSRDLKCDPGIQGFEL
jgi:hypothetical protein